MKLESFSRISALLLPAKARTKSGKIIGSNANIITAAKYIIFSAPKILEDRSSRASANTIAMVVKLVSIRIAPSVRYFIGLSFF